MENLYIMGLQNWFDKLSYYFFGGLSSNKRCGFQIKDDFYEVQ